MRFGNYEAYLKTRWTELDGEGATDAARRETGVFREQDMGWDNEATHPLAEQRAEVFKRAQMPIFIQIAGELHHKHGHRDVGLGKKNSGNRWELPGDDVATDILVLKDLDGSDAVQLVDCFSSMGGPETKPGWNEIEPNSDRSFVVPPVPAGYDVPVIGDPHDDSAVGPVGSVLRIDLAPIVAELLKPLEAENAELRKRIEALEARPAAAAGAELAEKYGLVSDRGTYLTAEETPAGKVTARGTSLDAWQQWRLVPVPKP
jgi:hypothetical protein